MASSGSHLSDLSRTALLDRASELAQAERSAQIDQLRLAAEWADANGTPTVDPEGAGRRGHTAPRFYGGQGTPKVATTAGADLGPRLGKSTSAGDSLIADALDLRHRLPEIWGRASYARFVARRTRDLTCEAASYVDHRCATYADGRLTWSRFEALVDASIKAADPALAEAKEKAAREARYAFAARQTEDGMRSFVLRTDAIGVARLDATVAHVADVLKSLGCTESVDHRRALAMVLLANPAEATKVLAAFATWKDRPADPPAASESPEGAEPTPDLDGIVADADDLWRTSGDAVGDGGKPVINWTALLPTLTLFIHLYAGRGAPGTDRGEAPEIIRIDGIGTATEPWLRTHLSLHPDHKLILRPVIDIEGLAPVDAWEIPERHRQAVRLMTPADCFPWGTATTNRSDGWRSMQIDHTEPWTPDGGPGQTSLGNLAPLTQFHHNLKTHCGWQVRQPFPGILIWRDPHGAHYLVDNTGTRRLS